MEINKKYTFIHPTKTGGTACEKYFSQHYNKYITGTGHNLLCTNNNNPIIIIRDIYKRFFSMFNYWKNGSEIFIRNDVFTNKNKNKTIIDFINMLKTNNKKELNVSFTWNQHFANISDWIGKTDYKNIIVIIYEDDLNDKIQKLLYELNIPNKNIPLPKINVSKKSDDNEKIYVDNKSLIDEFINEYFANDLLLMEKINTNPELFKLII